RITLTLQVTDSSDSTVAHPVMKFSELLKTNWILNTLTELYPETLGSINSYAKVMKVRENQNLKPLPFLLILKVPYLRLMVLVAARMQLLITRIQAELIPAPK